MSPPQASVYHILEALVYHRDPGGIPSVITNGIPSEDLERYTLPGSVYNRIQEVVHA